MSERIPEFIQILELLECTPKTNDKIKLLKVNEITPHLKEFLVLAVCDTVKFNIKELKEVDANPVSSCSHKLSSSTWDTFIRLTDALVNEVITGHSAIATINSFLQSNLLSDLEKKWYERCIKKDIASTKVGRKIMDTVWPGSVLYWQCMLATPEDQIGKILKEDLDTFIDGYAYGELKKNGMRTFQEVEQCSDVLGGKFTLAKVPVSRKGLPLYNFKDVTKLIAKVVSGTSFEDYMFEGECSVDDNLEDTMSVYGFDFTKTEDDYRGKSGKVGKGWEKYQADHVRCTEFLSRLKFTIFDLMPINEWKAKDCKKNYEERRADLVVLKNMIHAYSLSTKLDILDSKRFKTYSVANVWSKEVIASGYEGIIIKRPKHKYEWTRSKSWIKSKEEVETDVVIIGYLIQKQKYNSDGTKKPAMLGKFIVRDSEGRVFEVGTGKGWTEKFYTEALENFDSVYKLRVMKILAQKFTKKAAIIPRFNCWRDDKTWQDVLGEDFNISSL